MSFEHPGYNVKPICSNPQSGSMSTGGALRLCTNPEHRKEPDYATQGPVWHKSEEWPADFISPKVGTCHTHKIPHEQNRDCKDWKEEKC